MMAPHDGRRRLGMMAEGASPWVVRLVAALEAAWLAALAWLAWRG